MTSQSPLDRLAGPGNVLSKEPPDANDFAGLVRSGLARLRDAENTSNSLYSRFDLAYSAAHALCLAALPHVVKHVRAVSGVDGSTHRSRQSRRRANQPARVHHESVGRPCSSNCAVHTTRDVLRRGRGGVHRGGLDRQTSTSAFSIAGANTLCGSHSGTTAGGGLGPTTPTQRTCLSMSSNAQSVELSNLLHIPSWRLHAPLHSCEYRWLRALATKFPKGQ
jgi:hypothetical protein